MRFLALLTSGVIIVFLCMHKYTILAYGNINNSPKTENTNMNVVDSTVKLDDDTFIKISPASVQMYHYIKKYCEIYNVPTKIAFSVAGIESTFKDPMNFKYKHNVKSYANALGPMQLMYPTALSMSENKHISVNDVKNNVELNVKLGVKYLKYLHDRYHDWRIVLGCYNTGRPIINDYSRKCMS